MRNPEKTRQRLIEVTAQAMAQHGGPGVRVDRIAAESGINKRMIYHYFGDKDGVCAHVLALQVSALDPVINEAQKTLLRARLASLLPSEVLFVDQQGSESAVSSPRARSNQRPAVIVLRALLDTQGGTAPFDNSSADWLALVTRLCQLALVEHSAVLAPDQGNRSPKQRFSLSPVLQPVDA